MKELLNRVAAYLAEYTHDTDGMVEELRAAAEQCEKPVEYQFRMRPTWDDRHPWSSWEKCSKGSYEDYVRVPINGDWAYEVRALYLATPVQQCGEPVYVIVAEDNYFVEIEDSNGNGVRVTVSRDEEKYRKFGPLYLAPPSQPKPTNIDEFTFNLMQRVWACGNRHGPDAQRKAEIQCAIAEAFAGFVPPAQKLTEVQFKTLQEWIVKIIQQNDDRTLDAMYIANEARNRVVELLVNSAQPEELARLRYLYKATMDNLVKPVMTFEEWLVQIDKAMLAKGGE